MAIRYYLDTEFDEKPGSIDLISIGIVDESGREYYAVCSEYNYYACNAWVKKNVIEPMYAQEMEKNPGSSLFIGTFNKVIGKTKEQISKEILTFVKFPEYRTGAPEFWGYYADYDWVLFCWLFGAMIDLPEGFPMICMDLKQLLIHTKVQPLPAPKGAHNALVDAKWNKKLHEHILKETKQ